MDENGFLIDLSECERTAFGKIDFSEQDENQKVFSAVWELESQVNNGGFEQYFQNSDSDVISFAPTALKTIGAKACAAIVEEAIEIVAPLGSTEEERRAVSANLDKIKQDRLASLDTSFFEYPDNLTKLLFAFVAKHPEVFGGIPE